MNKYKKILEWLQDYNLIFKWIDFNVTPFQAGNMAVNSVSGARELETYMDDSRLVELLFSVVLIAKYGKGTSDTNVNAIEEFDNIQAWMEEQNKIGNLPEIDGAEEVVSLQLVPIMTVDSEGKLAKYQGQYKLVYMEE